MNQDLVMTGATADECWPLVRDYHYSRRMPSAIKHCYAWRTEGGLFGDTGRIHACVIYGQPVNKSWPIDALELQRLVRHPDLALPLSQLVAWSLRWLRENTNTPFVLSYADEGQGHHGGIYQATGFLYFGHRKQSDYPNSYQMPNGDIKHSRQVSRELGTNAPSQVALLRPEWLPIKGSCKHIYIKPIRQRLKPIIRRLKQLDKDGRFMWLYNQPFKPDNAARLSDAPSPEGVSQEHTLGAAPLLYATMSPVEGDGE